MSDLAQALEAVRTRIKVACDRADRDPAGVQLVAVSKTFSAAAVRLAVDAGQTLFGENRVQEALPKISEVGPGADWHLIGHLQRNKARHAVGVFELLHGVDSEALAIELDRRVGSEGHGPQKILVQVKLGAEATKFGVAPEALEAMLAAIARLRHLDLRGLMTIPPPAARAEDNRVWFRNLRELRDRGRDRHGLALDELSMGMTDDFEVAAEEGATLVRVGRAIFGERELE